MRNQRWKNTERKVADLLGGKRVPVTGRNRGDAPDIMHEILSPEVKDRKKLPGWIHDAMDQAEQSNEGHKIPIVVLHERGMKHEDDFVLMRIKDFVEGCLK